MLIRQDAAIQAMADESRERRRLLTERTEAMKKEHEALCDTAQAEENAMLKRLEAHLAATGVTVFNSKDHGGQLAPDEGVVWLVSKNEKCDCPVCRLTGMVVEIRT